MLWKQKSKINEKKKKRKEREREAETTTKAHTMIIEVVGLSKPQVMDHGVLESFSELQFTIQHPNFACY